MAVPVLVDNILVSPSHPINADKLDEPGMPVESTPLADALFKAIGERLDAGEAERELFSQLAEHLWMIKRRRWCATCG